MVTILTFIWLGGLPTAEARYNDYAVNKPSAFRDHLQVMIWDSEIREALTGFAGKLLFSTGSCFSGGFVDDLTQLPAATVVTANTWHGFGMSLYDFIPGETSTYGFHNAYMDALALGRAGRCAELCRGLFYRPRHGPHRKRRALVLGRGRALPVGCQRRRRVRHPGLRAGGPGGIVQRYVGRQRVLPEQLGLHRRRRARDADRRLRLGPVRGDHALFRRGRAPGPLRGLAQRRRQQGQPARGAAKRRGRAGPQEQAGGFRHRPRPQQRGHWQPASDRRAHD